MAWKFYTRLQKILTGANIAPKTPLEAAVKYAVDNSGGGGSVTVDTALADSTNPVQNAAIYAAVNGLAPVVYYGVFDEVSGEIKSLADGDGDPVTFAAAKAAVEAGKRPIVEVLAGAEGFTMILDFTLGSASWTVVDETVAEGEVVWSAAQAEEDGKGSIVTLALAADDSVTQREAIIT